MNFLADFSKVNTTIKAVRCGFLELRDLAIEMCVNYYWSINFAKYDAQEYLSLLKQYIISQFNANEMLKLLLRKVKEPIEKAADLIKWNLSLMEPYVNIFTEKLIEAMNAPEFVNCALVCGGFSIVGFLIDGLKGFVIGFILAILVLRGISQCPKGM